MTEPVDYAYLVELFPELAKGTATPEKQTLTFSLAPTSGNYKLVSGGTPTADIPFDATADEIQLALEAVLLAGNVDVTAPTTLTRAVQFVGELEGQDVAMLSSQDVTLLASATPVTIGIVETVKGSKDAERRAYERRIARFWDLSADYVADEQFGTSARYARALVMAHLMTSVSSDTGSASTAVQSEKVGDVSRTYAVGAQMSMDGLKGTTYGREFIQLATIKVRRPLAFGSKKPGCSE